MSSLALNLDPKSPLSTFYFSGVIHSRGSIHCSVSIKEPGYCSFATPRYSLPFS
jgi:hypothetical protein